MTRKAKNNLIIVSLILLLTVTLALCYVTFGIIRANYIVKQNHTVDAVLTDYRVTGMTHTAYPTCSLDYTYIDENGIEYTGSAGYSVSGYAAAEKAIEEKQTVQIYIDGKGNSISVALAPSRQKFITILIFAVVFVIATIVFSTLFFISKKKNKVSDSQSEKSSEGEI